MERGGGGETATERAIERELFYQDVIQMEGWKFASQQPEEQERETQEKRKEENERENPPWERNGFNKQQEEGEHTDQPTPDLFGLQKNQEECGKANETISKNLDKHMSLVNAMTVCWNHT